ncbi:MAG: hypothetical protein KDB07_09095 [Planctomycetes bacterium]|nr:hypothetical protein [Planctomycetota bacterium]
MRTASADRRRRILESLPQDRRARVKELKAKISLGDYLSSVDEKLSLVAEDLLDEALKLRT